MKPKMVLEYSQKASICDFCLNDENCNKSGCSEKLLACKDCDAKAHPSCMNYSAALAAKALTYPWQCIECKTCVVCHSANNGASILFCDGCDKAYHMSCHQPEVVEKPEGKWVCRFCFVEGNKEDNSHTELKRHGPTAVNGRASKKQDDKTKLFLNGSSTISPRIKVENGSESIVPAPFSVEWSADQVSDYFKSIGFEEQAHVFVLEEIDGRSLLLLKRSDIIEGLSLKLGPAVKIYERIAKLQNAIVTGCT